MNSLNNVTNNFGRKNNWSPLMELRQEVDRLFEDVWKSPSEALHTSQTWYPACDVSENGDHYLLTVEMAGIPKDQVQIEAIDNQLVISGERKVEDKKQEKGLFYSERHYGKFQRTFALPKGLETEKIEANYQDGVLQILIPKAEAAKSRKIKIGTSSGSFLGKLIGQSPHKEKEASYSLNEKSDKMVS
jgi:HSP20 family protein